MNGARAVGIATRPGEIPLTRASVETTPNRLVFADDPARAWRTDRRRIRLGRHCGQYVAVRIEKHSGLLIASIRTPGPIVVRQQNASALVGVDGGRELISAGAIDRRRQRPDQR